MSSDLIRNYNIKVSTSEEPMDAAFRELTKFFTEYEDIIQIIQTFDSFQISQDEISRSLMSTFMRGQLLTLLRLSEANRDLEFTEVVHQCLRHLALSNPLEDPLTGDKIEFENLVYISTGHYFSVVTLLAYNLQREFSENETEDNRLLLNPFTDEPFFELDFERILKRCRYQGIRTEAFEPQDMEEERHDFPHFSFGPAKDACSCAGFFSRRRSSTQEDSMSWGLSLES